jgi:dolichol-phosphate mannosyltransferase
LTLIPRIKPEIRLKELQKFFNNLELVVEPKRRGLGAAYIFGMLHAIEKLSAEAIMEFDGDFQHDPREIKNLSQSSMRVLTT